WPVLGTAVAAASPGFVRGLGQLDCSRSGKRFSDPGVADDRGYRLDPSTSFPLWQSTYPVTGLAAFSGSLRLSLPVVAGFIRFLMCNTQRLSWLGTANGLWSPTLKVGHDGYAG